MTNASPSPGKQCGFGGVMVKEKKVLKDVSSRNCIGDLWKIRAVFGDGDGVGLIVQLFKCLVRVMSVWLSWVVPKVVKFCDTGVWDDVMVVSVRMIMRLMMIMVFMGVFGYGN